MFSPEAAGPISLSARNPRRRQRNASEDSVAIRPDIKRIRRSGLTQETFVPPESIKANGHAHDADETSLTNGHVTSHNGQKSEDGDTASIALRPRGLKRHERERKTVRGDGIELTRNGNYAVTQVSNTPETLRETQGPVWHGDMYPNLGYGLAMTHSHALIWRYGQNLTPSETADVLEVPLHNPSKDPRHQLPVAILVSTSGEPGILVVMPTSGKVTYWESLSNATSADIYRQRQQSIQGSVGGLSSGETIVTITEAEPRGFLLTSSSGRLFHVAINDTRGRPSIDVQSLRSPVGQGTGVFGSLRNVFSVNAWKKDIAAVRAGPSTQRGQRYIIVGATTGLFQLWDMNWNGNQSIAFELDVKDDILKALSEGENLKSDGLLQGFELIDFAVIQSGVQGKELARQTGPPACSIMALTSLKVQGATKYSLVGLTLSGGSTVVEVVHPIACYDTPLSAKSEFHPRVLIPETNETAFLVFEDCVVLVSLVEVEESPDSQLQMEAHTLPEPFQDLISFKKSKPYRVVGTTSDSHERSDGSTSILIMVFGFGLIRVTAFSRKSDDSKSSRQSLSAQTKIEQAVFFGGLRQDLLDFTPRPEMRFAAKDIENAALSISHAIASSTSKYLPVTGPSMEQQLARRASALADLNKHIRLHYPAISRPGRWKMLMNAEKMAAAQALWQCYQASIKTPAQTKDNRNVFTELVEAIHPDYKIENQPEANETDGVRHWFIYDVWRLEWVVPYAEEIIETMFRESVEDREEFDLPTRARMAIEAGEIQLAALETAFHFREANLTAYGLEGEIIGDGVLVKGLEGLPEFWTSKEEVVGKVKMMTDICREIALAMDDPQNESPPDDGLSVDLLYKLAEENPRLVQVCCQVYVERYRWLESQDDTESKENGQALKAAYVAVQRDLLTRLAEISQSQPAIELAEKYQDMDALADIIDFEMQNAETSIDQEALTERIANNFVRYGTAWANAYFSRNLNGADAVRVLGQTAIFKKHLTKFLRTHEEYAKIGWINEILAEKDYSKASDFLGQVQIQGQESSTIWSQKIALSMQKLSILAGTSKGQIKDENAKSRAISIERALESLAIQDSMCAYIKPTVSDALDAEAEVDLAVQRVGSTSLLADKPALQSLLRQDLQHLLSHQGLPPDQFIDLLTLVSPDPVSSEVAGGLDARFFSALLILYSLHPTEFPDKGHVERIIWTRCILQDDWPSLNRTDKKSDSQVIETMSRTALYNTFLAGFRHTSADSSPSAPSLLQTPFWDNHPPQPPDDGFLAETSSGDTSVSTLRDSHKRHADAPEHTLTSLSTDLEKQAEELRTCVQRGRLLEWWNGLLEAARQQVRHEADAEGEDLARKVEVERELRQRESERKKKSRAMGNSDYYSWDGVNGDGDGVSNGARGGWWMPVGMDGVWEEEEGDGDQYNDANAHGRGSGSGEVNVDAIRSNRVNNDAIALALGGPETELRSRRRSHSRSRSRRSSGTGLSGDDDGGEALEGQESLASGSLNSRTMNGRRDSAARPAIPGLWSS